VAYIAASLRAVKSRRFHDVLRPSLGTGVDWLTAFGAFAVTAMLVFYALEDLGPIQIPAFAVACALGLLYGFMFLAVRSGRGGMG